MNKAILNILIFTVLILAGCEDVLEKRDLDSIDNEAVWEDPEVAQLYLNKIYDDNLPGFNATGNADLSDETYGSGDFEVMYGQLQVADGYGPYSLSTYGTIRRINIMIDELQRGNIEDPGKSELMAQAKFLRAWRYWDLVKHYGGVPIILEPQDQQAPDDALRIPRSTAVECVNQIVADLDSAVDNLPPSWSGNQYGRATRGAAAALKGRVLLHYASPQFNPEDNADRWQRAYDANQEAMNICEQDGYGLHDSYEGIFLDEQNPEAIFVRVFDGVNMSHGYENSVRPASVSNGNSVGGEPTWEFVQSYPMADGELPEGNPQYSDSTFWQNRDPRFYETIAYNSMEWDFAGRTGSDRQWTYVGNGQESGGSLTQTGFYLRKNVDPSLSISETPRTATDWVEIRFAEVMLNFAECANEIGNQDEAYDQLTALRERVGIPSGSDDLYGLEANMNKEAMREAVMLERKIELAFEDKRHWDMRRRNKFDETLNGGRRTGVQVRLDTAYIHDLNPGLPSGDTLRQHFEAQMRDTISWDQNYNDYFNTEYGVIVDEQDLNYQQPKYNFYAIPQNVLDRNPVLRQTINWGGDNLFDPLAEE